MLASPALKDGAFKNTVGIRNDIKYSTERVDSTK